MSCSVDEKDYKIVQGYYMIVAGLLKIAVVRFLRYCQNATEFAVSNRI